MSQALKKLEKQGKSNKDLVQMGKTFSPNKIAEYSDSVPEDLSEVENQIHKLKDKMWEVAWLIGKRLIVIRDNFLESTQFTSISDYAYQKFNFTRKTTSRFIWISGEFDRVTAQTHGSKLQLLQPLDNLSILKYLEWMNNEKPSYREIQERIKSENKKPGRPVKEINLNKTSLKVDLKKMGVSIQKEKQSDFLKDLEELIRRYSSNENV